MVDDVDVCTMEIDGASSWQRMIMQDAAAAGRPPGGSHRSKVLTIVALKARSTRSWQYILD